MSHAPCLAAGLDPVWIVDMVLGVRNLESEKEEKRHENALTLTLSQGERG